MAAVILPREVLEIVEIEIQAAIENSRNYDVLLDETLKPYTRINDSKKLSKKRREELFDFIKNNAITFSIAEISPKDIDCKGIAAITQEGFWDAVNSLGKKAQHVLTDHIPLKKWARARQTNITKGDNISINIAAASILAKVHRDRLMVKYAETYPYYGFEQHKGYGTKAHREAIFTHGPCEIHRKSFEPVKSWLKGAEGREQFSTRNPEMLS